jgi:uncharacterized heparinase superfamily protein
MVNASNLLTRGALVVRTARHLRFGQIAHRALASIRPAARPSTAIDEPFSGELERLSTTARRLRPQDMSATIVRADAALTGRFRFLNIEQRFDRIDWRARPVNHLWSYQFQYMDIVRDLAWAYDATGDSRYSARMAELIVCWIETPPGAWDGWDAFPTSARIMAWTQALLIAGHALSGEARDRIRRSLAAQAEHLAGHLEWALLANHLLKNFCALAVASALFDGPASRRWRAIVRRHLPEQLDAQINTDGGHVERSPMYHVAILGDLLEVMLLLEARGDDLGPVVRRHANAMAGCLDRFIRPDGTLQLINDSANGERPAAADVRAWSRDLLGVAALRDGAWSLHSSCFHGFAGEDRIIIDTGVPAPEYQPAHSHAGLLSFELDVAGVPLLVDAGVSGYDGDPYREYVRSTRAHNTVAIDDLDQSEMWGTFRVARRVTGWESRVEDLPGAEFSFAGSCSPYHDPGATHRRRIEYRNRRWTIVDRVDGATGRRIAAFYHFDPQWTVEIDGTFASARSSDRRVVLRFSGFSGLTLHRGEKNPVQGWHCPEFGRAQPAACIEAFLDHNDNRELTVTIEHEGGL